MSTTDYFGYRRHSDIANLKNVISVDEKIVVKRPIAPIIEQGPISVQALPLINFNLGQNKMGQLFPFPPKAMMKTRRSKNTPF